MPFTQAWWWDRAQLRQVLEPLAGLAHLKEVALVVWRCGDYKERRQPEVLAACKKLRERMAGGGTVVTVTFVE